MEWLPNDSSRPILKANEWLLIPPYRSGEGNFKGKNMGRRDSKNGGYEAMGDMRHHDDPLLFLHLR